MTAAQLFRKIPHKEASGDELRIECPFCTHKTGRADRSFHLYVNTRKQRWICFRCGSKGTLRYLLKKLHLDSGLESVTSENVNNREFNILETLMEGLYGKKIERSITVPIKYPRWAVKIRRSDPAYRYLQKRKFSVQDIVDYGLRQTEDGDAIFVPFFENSQFVYWQTRGIYRNEKMNPPNGEGLGKSFYLFGHDQAAGHDTIVICEGWADAITIGRNAVSIQGKMLSRVQADKLLALNAKRYVVMFDFDDDTQQAALDAADLLLKLSDGSKDIGIVNAYNKEKRDPNDMGRERCQELINNDVMLINGCKPFVIKGYAI